MSIAIVCHDAGGAEILSSWALRQKEKYYCVLEGPAIKIFERKLGNLMLLSLEHAIQQCDWFLCGTSWQSDLERKAICRCKESGKRVVAFLDHWVNYQERFLNNGELILPHEIWVGDQAAEEIARKTFPSTPVVFFANPYFEELLFELNTAKPGKKVVNTLSILYVCEPIREHAFLQHGDEQFWGYTEESALEYFLKNLNILGLPINQITIRPHPSETRDKYDWVKDYSEHTRISDGMQSLIEEISAADMIVGCESMAMVIALFANKRVLSCIPPGGRGCSLPQSGIEHLQTLVNQNMFLSHAI